MSEVVCPYCDPFHRTTLALIDEHLMEVHDVPPERVQHASVFYGGEPAILGWIDAWVRPRLRRETRRRQRGAKP